MRGLMMSTALAMALAAGSAWAQMSSQPPPPPSIPSIPDPGLPKGAGGAEMHDGAGQASPAVSDSEATFSAPSGQQMMASDLIGTTVRNGQGEPVGEVEDILLSEDGQIDGLVLSVGDFLGLGGKNVGIRMDKLKFASVSGPEPEVVILMSKDELSQAPEYGGGAGPNPPSPGNSDDSLTRAGNIVVPQQPGRSR